MNQVVEKIRQEIRNRGPISFSQFMEWALYCPVYGYYEKEGDTIGRHGDFYTSVSVGPLFGELLARYFAQRFDQAKSSGYEPLLSPHFNLVEAGAHRGELARDILSWLRQQRPDLYPLVQYFVVEPSPRRQQWQQRTLAEFVDRVRWISNLLELAQTPAPPGPPGQRGCLHGIIFSNELLDSLPVCRFGWDANQGNWFEWGVNFDGGRFCWTRLAPGAETQTLPDWPPELLRVLPNNFTVEVSPAAIQWWAEAARILEAGELLAFDYGLTTEELLTPERVEGTLRAYRGHQLVSDLLDAPGDQDLTAHVNFTSIQQAGEAEGLRTEAFLTQEAFLTRIAALELNKDSSSANWSPERVRQFQTLTHPNHLGHSFRVLVQRRYSLKSHSEIL